MQFICAAPDFDPARRDVEMLLTCAMRRIDRCVEVLCFQVQPPRHAIVFGQAEAPILRHDKGPPGRRDDAAFPKQQIFTVNMMGCWLRKYN